MIVTKSWRVRGREGGRWRREKGEPKLFAKPRERKDKEK
jgi:hypothetical protein